MAAWERVAEVVHRRRVELQDRPVDEVVARSKRYDQRGVSKSVISLIENARQESYAERSLRALAIGLDWTPDSIERVLAGADPEPLPDSHAIVTRRGYDPIVADLDDPTASRRLAEAIVAVHGVEVASLMAAQLAQVIEQRVGSVDVEPDIVDRLREEVEVRKRRARAGGAPEAPSAPTPRARGER